MNTSTYFQLAVVGVLASLVLSPLAYAEDGPNPPVGNFCVRIMTTLDDTYLARLAASKDTMTKRQGEADAKIARNRAERDAERSTKRAEGDTRLLTLYTKLTEKAGSDAGKIAAVNAFRTSVEAVVVTRRASIDAAISAYRAGHDLTRSSRSVELTVAFNAYEGIFKSAITKAQTDCAADLSAASVRAEFLATVQSAREQYKSARETANTSAKSKMETLKTQRTLAVDAAIATGKAAVEAARAALKAAFGN